MSRYSSPEQVTSELWSVPCHMGSYSVTWHPTQTKTLRLSPAIQAGTRLTYPGGMDRWKAELTDQLDLGSWLNVEMV